MWVQGSAVRTAGRERLEEEGSECVCCSDVKVGPWVCEGRRRDTAGGAHSFSEVSG